MSSIFKAIGNFFKKLFSALKKILAVVLIILAVIVIIWACIFCPPLGGTLFGIAFASSGAALAFGCCLLVGAFLVDKDTAAKVVGKVGEAAGDAAEAVGNAAGDVISGVVSGLFSSDMLLWVALGVGAYFLLSNRKDASAGAPEEVEVKSVQRKKTDDTVVVAPSGAKGNDMSVFAAPGNALGGVLYG